MATAAIDTTSKVTIGLMTSIVGMIAAAAVWLNSTVGTWRVELEQVASSTIGLQRSVERQGAQLERLADKMERVAVLEALVQALTKKVESLESAPKK